MLPPAKAKPKNCLMSGAGEQKGPDEPQAAVEKEVEEERIKEYKPQKDAMLGALQRSSSLASKTVRSVILPKEWRRSRHDELEAEYPEAVALMTIVKQRRAGKPSVLWRPQDRARQA